MTDRKDAWITNGVFVTKYLKMRELSSVCDEISQTRWENCLYCAPDGHRWEIVEPLCSKWLKVGGSLFRHKNISK